MLNTGQRCNIGQTRLQRLTQGLLERFLHGVQTVQLTNFLHPSPPGPLWPWRHKRQPSVVFTHLARAITRPGRMLGRPDGLGRVLAAGRERGAGGGASCASRIRQSFVETRSAHDDRPADGLVLYHDKQTRAQCCHRQKNLATHVSLPLYPLKRDFSERAQLNVWKMSPQLRFGQLWKFWRRFGRDANRRCH